MANKQCIFIAAGEKTDADNHSAYDGKYIGDPDLLDGGVSDLTDRWRKAFAAKQEAVQRLCPDDRFPFQAGLGPVVIPAKMLQCSAAAEAGKVQRRRLHGTAGRCRRSSSASAAFTHMPASGTSLDRRCLSQQRMD